MSRISWVPSRVRLDSLFASIKAMDLASDPCVNTVVCRKLASAGSIS